ncbi:MAG: SDR family NAD(P)-dependent oxidoreductase [Acidimicrobiales bacterium]
MIGALEGRQVLVTGATGGIGRVVSRNLADAGAALVLVGRDAGRLATLRDSLGPAHRWLAFDVSDRAAWEEAAPDLAPDGRLHGLVAAAAVLGPIGLPDRVAIDEFARTLEVNVVGTMLAVRSSLVHMEEGSSIVTFSGGGGTAPLERYDAYAASKAAVVRLTENLARELADRRIRVNSVAPGFVVTDIHRATLAAGPDTAGEEYFERTRRAVADGSGDSPEPAAQLVAFLLSEASDGVSGRLLSARWDPWGEAEFVRRLRQEPDLATLRRIDDQAFTAVRGGC